MQITDFLSAYPAAVAELALLTADRVRRTLPGAAEQVDVQARMIAYSYGPKYADLVCVILPSQKGVKLGFNRGPELDDPQGLLQGNAKTTRYVEMKTALLDDAALQRLLVVAEEACRKRRAQ